MKLHLTEYKKTPIYASCATTKQFKANLKLRIFFKVDKPFRAFLSVSIKKIDKTMVTVIVTYPFLNHFTVRILLCVYLDFIY